MSDPSPKLTPPVALVAADAPLRARQSILPAAFSARFAGREKRPLGDPFGLGNFGVNLTRLSPGAISSMHHGHSRQDEFIFVVAGTPTLITDAGETALLPGMCAGFPAGGTAHHLVNRSTADVVLLEVGDRTAGDQVRYPDEDLQATIDADGSFRFAHKDGTPY